MKRRTLILLTAIAAALVVGSGVAAAATSSITVPGTADPWLAGMPDGSTASDGDTAPAQSPTQVTGLDYTAGGVLKFDVSGSVNFFDAPSNDPPDGNSSIIGFTHGSDFSLGESENGISDINAPANSLIGVFLGPDRPDTSPAPAALDFGTAESRDYTSLSPALKQVFFIGDGRTSSGEVQQVNIPDGATRLFLGPMDGVQWSNNYGSFDVQAHHTLPTPADTTKPTTTATPSVAPNVFGWNKEDVTVTLSATDNEGGSGVKEITYSINGGQPTTEQGDSVQVPVTAEGTNTIAFYATDNEGNSEDEQSVQVKIDKTAPTVSSTSPPSNATGVSATAKVSATFSESGSGIDPSTLTASTFKVAQVKPSGNVPVSGTVSYDASSKTVTFTPSSSLAKGAYQATVTTGVEDRADNALASDYTWSFATAGPSKQ